MTKRKVRLWRLEIMKFLILFAFKSLYVIELIGVLL